MKLLHLMMGLALFASVSAVCASDEAKTRRAAVEKAIASEPRLHRQIQLAIFDAFETRRGLKGKAFYQRYNLTLEPEKFIKLVCERNFAGDEALKSMDKKLNRLEKERQRILRHWINEQQGENNPKRIKMWEKKTDVVRYEIRAIKEWKKIIADPSKKLPVDPTPKYFTDKLSEVAEDGLSSLGAGPADHMGAVNLEKLKKTFYQKGLGLAASPIHKTGGDVKEFATFYSEVAFYYAMKGGQGASNMTFADTQALNLWRNSKQDLAKARALFKKKQ